MFKKKLFIYFIFSRGIIMIVQYIVRSSASPHSLLSCCSRYKSIDSFGHDPHRGVYSSLLPLLWLARWGSADSRDRHRPRAPGDLVNASHCNEQLDACNENFIQRSGLSLPSRSNWPVYYRIYLDKPVNFIVSQSQRLPSVFIKGVHI